MADVRRVDMRRDAAAVSVWLPLAARRASLLLLLFCSDDTRRTALFATLDRRVVRCDGCESAAADSATAAAASTIGFDAERVKRRLAPTVLKIHRKR